MKQLSRWQLTFWSMFLMSVGAVSAQINPGDRFGWALEKVFDLPLSPYFSAYIRFAYFVIVFSVLSWGAQQAFKDRYTSAMKTAIAVIAIIAALGIPTSIVLFIYEEFTAVVSVLIAMIPVIAGFAVCHTALKGDSPFQTGMRAAIYILLAIITFMLSNHLANLAGPGSTVYNAMAEMLLWGAIIASVAGGINLLGTLAGGGATGAGAIANWFNNRGNAAAGGTGTGGTGAGGAGTGGVPPGGPAAPGGATGNARPYFEDFNTYLRTHLMSTNLLGTTIENGNNILNMNNATPADPRLPGLIAQMEHDIATLIHHQTQLNTFVQNMTIQSLGGLTPAEQHQLATNINAVGMEYNRFYRYLIDYQMRLRTGQPAR